MTRRRKNVIKEIIIDNPITSEGQPDGGHVPIVDPYDGCQLCCPYCFQMCDENWNKNIYVKTNIVKLLNDKLAEWPKSSTMYIGSRCDPYMQIEEKYCLTRNCLEVLSKWNIPTMITTKSDNGLIFRDLDLLKSFSSKLTILLGISNINQIKKGINNRKIEIANELHKAGIQVWVFITPVLPYLMNVDATISALNNHIPIFLDKLRIFKDNIQTKKMLDFIKKEYPEIIEQYVNIICNCDEHYFDDIKSTYNNNPRVTILF